MTDTSAPEAAQPVAEMTITGQLVYRERIAAHPDTVMKVTLNDISRADAPSVVLAHQRMRLDGKQVPIPFTLTVDPAKLSERGRYAVRGTLSSPDGQLMWTTDTAHIVTLGTMSQDLGMLNLVRVEQTAEAMPSSSQNIYRCGSQTVTTSVNGDRITIGLDGRTYPAGRVRSASGARYVSHPGAENIEFWVKGDKALLTVGDRSYPECIAAPTQTASLTGHEWVVEDVNGGGIIDNARVTVNFGDDGRIYGRSGCNSFSGSYTLDGMKLTTGEVATTLMACPPALMNLEQGVLRTINALTGYRFDAQGRLILMGASGEFLQAI